MRLRVESVEVQTLKANGKPWDGPGSAKLPEADLPRFFALDLTAQLEHLVAHGDAPNPPDVTVRLFVDGKAVLETYAIESFDPTWPDGPSVELQPGTLVTVEVRDLDLALHDRIGELTTRVPERVAGGRWTIGAFGQVRRLALLVE